MRSRRIYRKHIEKNYETSILIDLILKVEIKGKKKTTPIRPVYNLTKKKITKQSSQNNSILINKNKKNLKKKDWIVKRLN